MSVVHVICVNILSKEGFDLFLHGDKQADDESHLKDLCTGVHKI